MTVEFSVETITPAKARQYIEKNTRNRKLSNSTVKRLASAIDRGEWCINGEAIKFDETGRLLDGQHRLSAILIAGKAIETCVVRNLDPDVFNTLDAGKARNAGDTLYVLDYKNPNALAAAARSVFAYERNWISGKGGARRISNKEVLAVVERHKELPRLANQYMRRPLFTSLVPHSVGMFGFYLAAQINLERMSVSSETRYFEEAIYLRLLAWGVWVENRTNPTDRIDEISGGLRITPSVRDRLNTVRHGRFPHEIEAVEKAVAAVMLGPHPELYECLQLYFLKWMTIDEVARALDQDYRQVVDSLRRAIRAVSRTLPACERACSAARGERRC